jgi:Na+/H+-dicarboxylate symporter
MTTAIAIAVAIGLASVAGIGEGMNLQSTTEFSGKQAPPLTEVFINIIPANPIQAMANGDMLPIIFFAILTGISILMIGKKSH